MTPTAQHHPNKQGAVASSGRVAVAAPRPGRLVALGTAIVLGVSALTACGSTKPSATPASAARTGAVLRVTMSNSGTKISGSLERHPGPVTFEANSASGDHQLQLFKLAAGYSLAQMDADGQAAFGPHPDLAAAHRYLANVTSLGGVEIFPGAHSASFTQTLTDGTYYAGELPEDQNRMPTIHVSGAAAPSAAPSTTGTITALDSGWHKSTDTLPAAASIVVRNAGRQPHFLILSPVATGTTRDQVGAYLRQTGASQDAPPPPFARNGPQLGTATLSPGTQMVFTYNLPPGEYAMVCFFPDLAHAGQPQALEGLFDVITLR